MPVPTAISITVATAAVIAGMVTSALAACGHPGTGEAASQSHTAPSITADGLIVGLDDVRRIAGENALTLAPEPNPHHEPSHFDSALPPACQAVFDQRTIFDGHWTQFASTTAAANVNHGADQANSIADVGQAVAVYPDDTTARRTFTELTTKLTACRALNVRNYDFTLDDSDPTTLVLSNRGWTVVYRVKSAVLLTVAALGLQQAGPVARTLAQTISDRIH